jgi:hypothetical protein
MVSSRVHLKIESNENLEGTRRWQFLGSGLISDRGDRHSFCPSNMQLLHMFIRLISSKINTVVVTFTMGSSASCLFAAI